MAKHDRVIQKDQSRFMDLFDQFIERLPVSMGTALSMASLLLIFLLWSIVAPFYPDVVIPSPMAVVSNMAAIVASGEFLTHTGITLFRVLAGFTIAFSLSIFFGVLMGLFEPVEHFFKVEVLIGITIPGLIWAIVSAMWFGLSDFAMIFAVMIVILPLLTLTIWEGTKNIDTGLIEMGDAFGASQVENLRNVIVPQIIPSLLTGARLGLALGWKVAVVAEMVMSDRGVGFKLAYHFGLFDMKMILAWAMLFTMIIFVIEFGIIYPIEKRVTAWRPSKQSADIKMVTE